MLLELNYLIGIDPSLFTHDFDTKKWIVLCPLVKLSHCVTLHNELIFSFCTLLSHLSLANHHHKSQFKTGKKNTKSGI